MELLQVHNITKEFGGLVAVNDVSFQVKRGEIFSIIGPNGAGKTTLFNMISGIYLPTAGDILFEGTSIKGKKPYEIAHLHITRTFQSLQVFHNMTVLENIMVGRHCFSSSLLYDAAFKTRKAKREEREIRERSYAILKRVGLEGLAHREADTLSFGQQRVLELGRGLALEPKLMLLDEPTSGLNREETLEVVSLIEELSHEGMNIILVEHDMETVMSLADRIIVLNNGARLALGEPHEIQENEAVIKAYLGEEY